MARKGGKKISSGRKISSGKKDLGSDSLFTFKKIFKLTFGAVSGYMFTYFLMALFTVIISGIGLYLLIKYNKEDEKIKTQLLDDLQTGQYVGIVIFIIGLLPWFQYIMMGFGTKGGAWAFDKLVHK